MKQLEKTRNRHKIFLQRKNYWALTMGVKNMSDMKLFTLSIYQILSLSESVSRKHKTARRIINQFYLKYCKISKRALPTRFFKRKIAICLSHCFVGGSVYYRVRASIKLRSWCTPLNQIDPGKWTIIVKKKKLVKKLPSLSKSMSKKMISNDWDLASMLLWLILIFFWSTIYTVS